MVRSASVCHSKLTREGFSMDLSRDPSDSGPTRSSQERYTLLVALRTSTPLRRAKWTTGEARGCKSPPFPFHVFARAEQEVGLLFLVGARFALDPREGTLDRRRQANDVHPFGSGQSSPVRKRDSLIRKGSGQGRDRRSSGRHVRRLAYSLWRRWCATPFVVGSQLSAKLSRSLSSRLPRIGRR